MRKMIFQPLEDSTLVRFYTDSRTLKFAPKKVTFTACTESVGRSVSVEWEKKVISAIGEIPPQIWQCFHRRERFSAHHKRFPIYDMRAQFAAHSFIEGESALAVFGRSFYPRVSSLQLSDSWTESLSQHSQSNSSTGPCGVCGCTLLPVGVIQRKGTVDMEDLD